MFITQALVYVGSRSVNHSCCSGTAGVSGCFTSIKNRSDSLRFCRAASARFLKIERYSRKGNVLNNMGRVNSFAAGGSLEIVRSICFKGSLAGTDPWIPNLLRKQKPSGIKESLGY